MTFQAPASRRAVLQLGLATAAFGAAPAFAGSAHIDTAVDANRLSKSRQTPLGLYLTPSEAHKALVATPDILFVDVRDPIEVTFVGHPSGLDKIIPLRVASHQVDPATGQYVMLKNPNVLAEFEALVAARGTGKDHPIFVTCRSGSRSAAAARMLIKAGYTNVWNLIEGFEGDKNANGSRAVNGWRNAGLPWGYRLPKGVAWTG